MSKNAELFVWKKSKKIIIYLTDNNFTQESTSTSQVLCGARWKTSAKSFKPTLPTTTPNATSRYTPSMLFLCLKNGARRGESPILAAERSKTTRTYVFLQ